MSNSSRIDAYNEEEDCYDPNYILDFTYDDYLAIYWVKVLVGILYSLLLVGGIVGNGGVIVAVTRNPRLRTARNIFLLNLMASDLLLCLTTIPISPFSAINKAWIFGSFLCRLIPLVQSMSVLITSWSLTAIAMDKFIHIRDSTKPPIRLVQALIIMLVIWILACLVNVPFLLSFKLESGASFINHSDLKAVWCGMYCSEEGWNSMEHKKIYGTSIMALQFVIPTVIITFCYSEILRIVRRDMIIDNSTFASSLSADQRRDATRKKRKVNYILISMVVAFVVAWFPMTLVNILLDFALAPEFILDQPWFYNVVCHFTAMTTVIWNPILFFWLTRQKKKNETIGTLAASHARLRVWMMEHFGKIGRSRSNTEADIQKNRYSISVVSYNDSGVTMHTTFPIDSPKKKLNGRHSSSTQRSPVSDNNIPSETEKTIKLDERDVKFLDPPKKSVKIEDFGVVARTHSASIPTETSKKRNERTQSVNIHSANNPKVHSSRQNSLANESNRPAPSSSFSLPDFGRPPTESTPLIIQNNGRVLISEDSTSDSSDSNVPTILVTKPVDYSTSHSSSKKNRPVVYVKLGSSTRC